MAAVSRGATISIQAVPHFDQLPPKEAEDVLYNKLIPACEALGIMLSSYGNHAGKGSSSSVEEYHREKADHKLFNVKRIQQVYASLGDIVRSTKKSRTWSYVLKDIVGVHPSQNEYNYISHGDLIAAMLLSGFDGRFGKKTERMGVNCEFKVEAN